jgi:hypothetical protein
LCVSERVVVMRVFEKRTLLGVGGLLIGVGRITPNHLRVLGDADALALDDLDVVQAAEDLVLDLELGAHGELGVLLDLEGLVLERLLAARLGEVDGDGVPAGRVHGQGQDDAHTGVIGVRDRGAASEAQGFLVALEGFVVGIWGGRVCVSNWRGDWRGLEQSEIELFRR